MPGSFANDEEDDLFQRYVMCLIDFYSHSPESNVLPTPIYNGPRSWKTDSIINGIETMARRMITAEMTLQDIDEDRECGPSKKKRRSVDFVVPGEQEQPEPYPSPVYTPESATTRRRDTGSPFFTPLRTPEGRESHT